MQIILIHKLNNNNEGHFCCIYVKRLVTRILVRRCGYQYLMNNIFYISVITDTHIYTLMS